MLPTLVLTDHHFRSTVVSLVRDPSRLLETGCILTHDLGLYDYGPPGTSLQSQILDVWRKHFVRKL